jgi:hypothetical protein
MADLVTLTQQPIRLSQANGAAQRQAIYLAVDVGAYDVLDLECIVVALEGTSPTIKVNVVTGMQIQTEDGWVVAGSFNAGGAITTSNSPYLLTLGNNSSAGAGLLRYVRWDVTAFSATGTFATLWIRGMARRLA